MPGYNRNMYITIIHVISTVCSNIHVIFISMLLKYPWSIAYLDSKVQYILLVLWNLILFHQGIFNNIRFQSTSRIESIMNSSDIIKTKSTIAKSI